MWFASADVSKPETAASLTQAVKDGALAFGEIKNQVQCDGPEMKRMYALAADLNVPIQIHFGDVPQPSGNAVFNGGFKRFDAMLKAYPKTRFIAHADTFWANVSSDYAYDTAYPSGPIKPGGISDKWLSDYPNLWADMSANSCNNALNRDPDFMAGFLARHRTSSSSAAIVPVRTEGAEARPIPRRAFTANVLRGRRWRRRRGFLNRMFCQDPMGKRYEAPGNQKLGGLRPALAQEKYSFLFSRQSLFRTDSRMKRAPSPHRYRLADNPTLTRLRRSSLLRIR